MTLSICIVTHNSWDVLQNCLRSIYENIKKVDFEIIVVDNASSDGTKEFIKEQYKDIKLIVNENNLYFAKGNNQGFNIARGEFILFLNPDIIFEEDLSKLVEIFKEREEIGAITCKLKFPNGTIQNTCSRFRTPLIEILEKRFISKFFPNFKKKFDFRYYSWDRDIEKEVDVAPNSFLMVRKSILEKIGGYDERFLLYYTEDDLCYRIKNKGYKILFIPNFEVIHFESASVKKKPKRLIKKIYKNDMFNYYRKYYGNIIANLVRIIANL
jgi:GT2 family glycosyltransferase